MKKSLIVLGMLAIVFACVWSFLPALQFGVISLMTVPIIGTGSSQAVIKGLTEQMGKAHRSIVDLDELVEREKRAYTPEEDQKRQAWATDFDNAREKRERLLKNDERDHLMREVSDEIAEKRDKSESRDEFKEKYSAAFRNYILGGLENLDVEQRALLNTHLEKEQRDLNKGTAGSGGYTVPEGFMNQIDIALKYYGGVIELGSTLNTATGKDIPWPVVNDTTNTGELLGEASSIGDSVDAVFNEVILKAYKFSSKKILISPELLDDNEVNIEEILAAMIGERIGRIINYYGTIGNGSGQPQGFVAGATNSGISGVAASAITFENLIDLQHSVDFAYRKNGKWAFNDNTLKALRKIKDGEDRYIWQPSLTSDAPATILGSPYVICTDMANIGAGLKSVVYGDFSKFKVRMVAGYRFRRLMELNAATDQIGYIAFKRADTRVINAGTNPLKYMVHASS